MLVNLKFSEEIFDPASKSTIPGESRTVTGEIFDTWKTIYNSCQPGIKGYKSRETLKNKPMLSDMLTKIHSDDPLIVGLNEANIFEGPINVGNQTGVAIPPCCSLNDHATTAHCAERRLRRQITVDNIIPNFEYQTTRKDEFRIDESY